MLPSMQPSQQPTMQPSQQPSNQPSSLPTNQPSQQPTQQPTTQPTQQPTNQPSQQPTMQPTMQPSRQPTSQPTRQPTQQPTSQPTRQPTSQPSRQPTCQPSQQPSIQPSQQPSQQPTQHPTSQPSMQPSRLPSSHPTSRPTAQPLQISQSFVGVTTTAAIALFTTNIAAALTASLPANCALGTVTILCLYDDGTTDACPTSSRLLRSAIYLQARKVTGVSVKYTVIAPPSVSGAAIATSLSSSTATSAISSSLATTGLTGITVQAPIVQNPTNSPTIAPTYLPTYVPSVTSSPSPLKTPLPTTSPTYSPSGETTPTSTLVIIATQQLIADASLLQPGGTLEKSACLDILSLLGTLQFSTSSSLGNTGCASSQIPGCCFPTSPVSRRKLLASNTLLYTVNGNSATSAQITGNTAALQNQLTSQGFAVTVAPATTQIFTRTSSSITPANSPSSAACFSGTEYVTLVSGDFKSLSEVDIGDSILTMNVLGRMVFSDIVYLPHGHNQQRTTFTMITTETGRDLKMTMNHVIPAGDCAATILPSIAANRVMVGDCVQTISGHERVVSLNEVAGQGIYTVIAMEELIVVNGIVVTPYGGVNPSLANIYYNIHRLVYSVFSNKLFLSESWLQDATQTIWTLLSRIV